MDAFRCPCRRFALAIALAAAASSAPQGIAQELMAPTYARVRHGADDWPARGWHGGGWGGFGYGYGFVQPFFTQPIVTGSYYQRPYPYHFDYYRHRWGGQPPAAAPTPDCPCAVDGTQPAVN